MDGLHLVEGDGASDYAREPGPPREAVIGIDLSLTSTGIADPDGTRAVRSRQKGMARLDELRRVVLDACAGALLVVLEDYAYHGHDAHAHALGELGGVIRWSLWTEQVSYLNVKASSLKLYASGKGNSPKAAVLAAAVKRSGIEFQTDDEADAWWLRAIGTDLLAARLGIGEPLIGMPAQNRKALDALSLPPLPSANPPTP